MPKGGAAVGVEFDSRSIRAAKVRPGKGGMPFISGLEEIHGSFTDDNKIVEGLRTIRQKAGVSFTDVIVTCVGGRQTYAAQHFFRRLPDEELKSALKLEIRKNLSFDAAASTLEYRFLAPAQKNNDAAPVIVASASDALLQRHMQLFEKAGMPPNIIEAFPLTIANAFRASAHGALKEEECGEIIIHIGPEFTTLVIDGNTPNVPFYNRTIYFSAYEIFDKGAAEPLSPEEAEQRIGTFTAEISRSLAYYQSASRASTGTSITVLGSYTPQELLDAVSGETRLKVERLNLAAELDSRQNLSSPGRFDIAVALAMRGGER